MLICADGELHACEFCDGEGGWFTEKVLDGEDHGIRCPACDGSGKECRNLREEPN